MVLGLLPAFRDLRAPLVAGYIWIVTAWLGFHTLLASSRKSHGALRSIYGLAHDTGPSGVVIAATALAYLAGSVTQFGIEAFGRWRNNRRGGAQQDLENGGLLKTHIEQLVSDNPRLLDVAELEYQRQNPDQPASPAAVAGRERRTPARLLGLTRASTAEPTSPSPLNATEAAEARTARIEQIMVDNVVRELPRVARRMRGSENELYDEYDRLIGEAQFREAILIPLASLTVVLAVTMSWSVSVALLILPLLKRQAVHQWAQGNEVIMDAILVRKVEAPSLERLQRLANLDRPRTEHQDVAG
jgi:hypothetical protein